MQFSWTTKNVTEVLDYGLNWVDELEGDTISVSTWTLIGTTSGLTISTDSHTPTTTTVWLSAGNVGVWTLKNTITTAGGRTINVLVKLPVRA